MSLPLPIAPILDRKSTRLNSSHQIISYAVFCLKKKHARMSTGLSPTTTARLTGQPMAAAPRAAPGSPRRLGRGPALRPRARGTFRFFFNDTATTEIYTLSLHDALPISAMHRGSFVNCLPLQGMLVTAMHG